MKVGIFKVPQNSPDDLTALDDLIQSGKIDPAKIVAILGKTEGNGCVNDFTRGFAVQSLQNYLAAKVNPTIASEIIYVISGGTEGVLSPHLTLFTKQDSSPEELPHWGLALGTHRTRNFSPDEIGTLTMVQEVAIGVKEAIAQANLSPDQVHFVQIKCPLVTAHRRLELNASTLQDSYQSMAFSRGASALGVAVALGELDYPQITEEAICHNYSLYSTVASTSAGVELQNCEILVLGNAPTSTSSFVIGHSVMQHALDTDAVHTAIASTRQPIDALVNVFAKAEADPSGTILGCRHTMLDDSDISHTRMARSVVGAVIASIVRDPMIYVSGGSEHQGPAGGGPIAAIAKRPDGQS